MKPIILFFALTAFYSIECLSQNNFEYCSTSDFTTNSQVSYLHDVYGNTVLSGESQNIINNLDTSSLDAGTYYLHFYENGSLLIKHIVVSH